ncbi:MAG: hypothetical protein H6858_02160 [Rhodospirillales bacterium]|nr:hypothetical protein [Alphaproteobacteria bacterium]MCB1840186.1 hypothetical protein [Alphaproteobacteria bacterium]MCB9976388.1 hypothetical protein [Rhodospirillales bacterium]
MNLQNKTPMARAEYYLLEMRQGRFQDETGRVVYPNQFEKEIETFELGRDVALMILDTKEEELRTFDFLFLLGTAKDSMERIRLALNDNRLHDAYKNFEIVQEFVEGHLFGLTNVEALNFIGLDEKDYKQMIESFAFVRRSIAKKQKSTFNGVKD